MKSLHAEAGAGFQHQSHGARVCREVLHPRVQASGNGHYRVGETLQVEAMLDLPGLAPKDLSVQLVAGPVNVDGELEDPRVVPMRYERALGPNRHLFIGTIDCRTSGRQGYSLRIVPGYADMATPFEPGLIIWN
jgi:starch phosphorylase